WLTEQRGLSQLNVAQQFSHPALVAAPATELTGHVLHLNAGDEGRILQIQLAIPVNVGRYALVLRHVYRQSRSKREWMFRLQCSDRLSDGWRQSLQQVVVGDQGIAS